jgi:peptide-methionine (S)-S-oxide reductase
MAAGNKFLSRIVTGFSILFILWGTLSCTSAPKAPSGMVQQLPGEAIAAETTNPKDTLKTAGATETAIFAGGCFWCMEKPFDLLPGVVSTTSGYTGGRTENPSYEEVSSGQTGHFEAMKVLYDPKQVSYETLLDTFWVNVDPVDSRGQFCDKGDQYRSAIFYETPEQQSVAVESKAAIATQLNQPIATEILPAAPFYDAEDYHQNYYQTHAVRYKVYRFGCGRDQRLATLWGADAPEHESGHE